MSAASAKTSEPSMEEILASIRRIISDDQTTPPQDAQAAATDFDGFDHDVISVSQDAQRESEPVTMPQSSVDDLFDQLGEEEELEFQESEPEDELPEEEPHQEMHEAMEEAMEESDGFDELELESPLAPEPVYTPAPAQMFEAPPARPYVDDRLLSRNTDNSVSNAFSSLAHTILSQNGRTIDDLVTEMLRPMLKNWLDDNLPTIVERLVRSEIERVARGGRG
jgi:uncharacterized protein